MTDAAIRSLNATATDVSSAREESGLTSPELSLSSASTLPSHGPDQRRVNVNFSQSAYEVLEQLARQKGKSMSDVLRDAIQLEKWISDAQTAGWHVLLERDGRVRELVRI